MQILQIIGAIVGIVVSVAGIIIGFVSLGIKIGTIGEKVDSLIGVIPTINRIDNDLTANDRDTVHAEEIGTEALQMVTSLGERVSTIEGAIAK